jgi:hypothetical protein
MRMDVASAFEMRQRLIEAPTGEARRGVAHK